MKNIVVMSFFFVFSIGLAVACAIGAVVWWGRGEYATVIVVVGFGCASLGLATSLVLILRGEVTPRPECGDQGTTVRPDRVVGGLQKGGMVGAHLGMATYAIFTPLGMIDLPQPRGNHQYLVILAAGGTLWGIVDLWKTFKPGGTSFVRLTPDGFEMSQGSSSMDNDWDDVEALSDRRPGKAPPLRAMLFVKTRDGRTRTQVIDSYTPEGDALRK